MPATLPNGTDSGESTPPEAPACASPQGATPVWPGKAGSIGVCWVGLFGWSAVQRWPARESKHPLFTGLNLCPHKSANSIVQIDEVRTARWTVARSDPPTRRALAMAVIQQPLCRALCGEPWTSWSPLAKNWAALLGASAACRRWALQPEQAQSYGKAAVVGEAGETGTRRRHPAPQAGRTAAPGRQKRARRWCPRPRSRAAWAPRWTCRWATKTPPSCAATSTPWKPASAMRRAPTRYVVAVVVTDSGRPLPRIGGLQVQRNQGPGRPSVSATLLPPATSTPRSCFTHQEFNPMKPLLRIIALLASLCAGLCPAGCTPKA